MGITSGHFRHILLFHFRKGKNAVQGKKKSVIFTVSGVSLNVSVKAGSLVFIPEILLKKMHHALNVQLKLITIKAMIESNQCNFYKRAFR